MVRSEHTVLLSLASELLLPQVSELLLSPHSELLLSNISFEASITQNVILSLVFTPGVGVLMSDMTPSELLPRSTPR